MEPLNNNSPYIDSTGKRSTLGAEISGGGGGGGYTLPTASSDVKGGVKIGSGLSMDGEVLNSSNPTPYSLPTASGDTKGGVKIGSGLSMDGEVLNSSNPTPYSLPTASGDTKGGVKIGSGLSMDGEVLSASGMKIYYKDFSPSFDTATQIGDSQFYIHTMSNHPGRYYFKVDGYKIIGSMIKEGATDYQMFGGIPTSNTDEFLRPFCINTRNTNDLIGVRVFYVANDNIQQLSN